MESEETQDYVRKAKDTDQETEELSFVPSAIRCDNQCSAKNVSFRQLASVVIQEGEESYTTNLCQKCYNESLKAKGDEPLTEWKWHAFADKRRIVECFGK